jgi:hypothetical protein
VNRGEASIARAHGVVAGRFQVREELEDQLRGQILEPECCDGAMGDVPREPQQQLEGVAIRRGGVPADVALRREMADEEGADEGREIGAGHDGLPSVMR